MAIKLSQTLLNIGSTPSQEQSMTYMRSGSAGRAVPPCCASSAAGARPGGFGERVKKVTVSNEGQIARYLLHPSCGSLDEYWACRSGPASDTPPNDHSRMNGRAAGESSASLVGSERVRRHPHRRARSGPQSGVSRGPRAYRVRVPIVSRRTATRPRRPLPA